MPHARPFADPALLRQLCQLGAPTEAIVPALLRALRREVRCASGAFYWVDGDGEITDLYAEKMPAPKLTREYFARRRGEDAGRRFRERLLEQAQRGETVREVSADASVQSTSFYRDVLQPLGAHRRLYGIVRNNGTPAGLLALYRSAEQPSFSAGDRGMVEAACRYLAYAGARQAPAPGADMYRDSGNGALLNCDADGNVLDASPGGYALLAQASGCPVNRSTAAGELESCGRSLIRRALAEWERAAEDDADGPARALTSINKWGMFRLRTYETEHTLGVLIERYEHLLVRLVDAMCWHDLSVQQREVLLLLAQGQSHAGIAEQLNVTANTVDYHVKQLYAKLGAHSRDDAIARVLDGHTARAH